MASLRFLIGVVVYIGLLLQEEVFCQPASHAEAFSRIKPSDLRALQTFAGRRRPTKPQPDLSVEADVKFEQAPAALSTDSGNARISTGVGAPIERTTVAPTTTPTFPATNPMQNQRLDPIVVSASSHQGDPVGPARIPFRQMESQQQSFDPIVSPSGHQEFVPIESPRSSFTAMEPQQGSSENFVPASSHQQSFVPLDSPRVPFHASELEPRVSAASTQPQSFPFDSAPSVPSRQIEPRPESFEPLVPASIHNKFIPFDSPRVPFRAPEPEPLVPISSQSQIRQTDVPIPSQVLFNQDRAISNIMEPTQLPQDVPTEQPTALIWNHPPQNNFIFLRKVIVRRYRASLCPGYAFGCYYLEPVLNIVYIPLLMA